MFWITMAGFKHFTLGCVFAVATAVAYSQLAQVNTDIVSLRNALKAYATDNGGNVPTNCNGGFPSDNRYWLRLLTTPVAYLNSLPTDSYQTTTNTSSFPLGRFAYQYYEKQSAGVCTPAWPTRFGALPLGANAQWALVSAGPDYDFDYLSQPQPWSPNLLYDATNGTASSGDLIYFDVIPTRAKHWEAVD
jgi:hypothetical protein